MGVQAAPVHIQRAPGGYPGALVSLLVPEAGLEPAMLCGFDGFYRKISVLPCPRNLCCTALSAVQNGGTVPPLAVGIRDIAICWCLTRQSQHLRRSSEALLGHEAELCEGCSAGWSPGIVGTSCPRLINYLVILKPKGRRNPLMLVFTGVCSMAGHYERRSV